jgi:UDPglucose--hexose-1-phosphate uridylyltransferase
LEAPDAYNVHWFPNRWPALSPPNGVSEVVLFSPEHDASLATLPLEQVVRVVDLWAERTQELLARDDVEYVLVFENRGAEVGATIQHPHGQIYGYPFVPPVPEREAAVARKDGCAVCAEITSEVADGTRVVAKHGDWVAYVPHASGYPYGLRIAPRQHIPSLPELDHASRTDLARVLRDALGRYDRLWGVTFPYLLWFHQAPATGGDEWHVHAHTAPPLRSPGVARFVASGELGSGMLQNPVAPEEAAQQLRDA